MEDKIRWIEDNDYALKTVHIVSKEFAAKTLKALYDEWPGGLEEIKAEFRTLRKSHAKDIELSTKIINDLRDLVQQLMEKK